MLYNFVYIFSEVFILAADMALIKLHSTPQHILQKRGRYHEHKMENYYGVYYHDPADGICRLHRVFGPLRLGGGFHKLPPLGQRQRELF